MNRRIATAVAVIAVAACTQCGTGTTTVAPTNTVPLGPHSKLGDLDMPAGSTMTSYTGPDNSNQATEDETWKYPGSYDDAVAVLKPQLDGRGGYTVGQQHLTACSQKSGVTDWLYSTDANGVLIFTLEVRVYRENLIRIRFGPAAGVCSSPMD
jgi:hypothetical protein